MTKYNSYAKKLDELFREARDTYAALVARMEEARREDSRAKAWFVETYVGERETRRLTAAARVREECARFRSEGPRVWAEFDAKAKALRKEFTEAIKAGSLASPDDVDANALELLKSGVLTPDDMIMFADRYDGNPTMLKLISKYANDAAIAARDSGNKPAFVQYAAVAESTRSGDAKIVKAFDELATTASYCSGVSHGNDRRTSDPDHTVRMGREWERLTSEKIANF